MKCRLLGVCVLLLIVSAEALRVQSQINLHTQATHALGDAPFSPRPGETKVQSIVMMAANAFVLLGSGVFTHAKIDTHTHTVDLLTEVFLLLFMMGMGSVISLGLERGVLPIQLDKSLATNDGFNNNTASLTLAAAFSYREGHIAGTVLSCLLALLPLIESLRSRCIDRKLRMTRIAAALTIGLTFGIIVHANHAMIAKFTTFVFLGALIVSAFAQYASMRSGFMLFLIILLVITAVGSVALTFLHPDEVVIGGLQWTSLALFVLVMEAGKYHVQNRRDELIDEAAKKAAANAAARASKLKSP